MRQELIMGLTVSKLRSQVLINIPGKHYYFAIALHVQVLAKHLGIALNNCLIVRTSVLSLNVKKD
ncbi:MAG: hypothetical protein JGK17_25800 [Microcoleus sp. PH2017_10_PVI_O_A]|uniref:hypothetical protein n=1 Tax=unclassified Microcoleus TaxID=2642155 RepID=UPI001DCA23F1|nr:MULTISPECIES: hypothetical protein [unclassified Microcoleus]TAE78048.1 MAG: hypothetical protein EAZ83_25420 [Oscillatoriales cyanobacterium]MCC3408926.1 hypothetical protein [Microcoleus sp. PH2017_10_PVI_O_A]MCC3463062.1 hypothetical protein [Microcoleus sp. PH2017_11_PCY_U_A]MCC3481448.1 hypothetical protein [Microcoleus sp. PH2017_12_PCY_D_A]MCC3531448.1 hypothetical protein [Microcoleus sp. PH2017_21_RUC_O_A]